MYIPGDMVTLTSELICFYGLGGVGGGGALDYSNDATRKNKK